MRCRLTDSKFLCGGSRTTRRGRRLRCRCDFQSWMLLDPCVSTPIEARAFALRSVIAQDGRDQDGARPEERQQPMSMQEKRIVIDARCLRGAPGGVATYTAALVQHLPALLPNVPFVLIHNPAAPGPLSIAPNVTEWPL